MDWFTWHDGYNGELGARLEAVQLQLDAALADVESSSIRIISVCAGQGHDVVGSLQRFERRDTVEALLIELDDRNVRAAERRIAEAGLSGVIVEAGDAGVTNVYEPMTPADIILVCGVFGSLTDEDVDRTISILPSLAAPSAQVIWTAHRAAPGLWDSALRSFSRHGFEEIWANDRSERFGVGRHRLDRDPDPFRPDERLFTFADEDTLVRIGRTRT